MIQSKKAFTLHHLFHDIYLSYLSKLLENFYPCQTSSRKNAMHFNNHDISIRHCHNVIDDFELQF